MHVHVVRRPQTGNSVARFVLVSCLAFALWGSLGVGAWLVVKDTRNAGPESAHLAAAAVVGAGSRAAAVEPPRAAASRPATQPQPPAPPAGSSSSSMTQSQAGRYTDERYGFAFDYPQGWMPTALPTHSAPGTVLGLTATPVPGAVSGVEFPNSSHVDFSLLVQDRSAVGAEEWGTTPSSLLRSMAASEGMTRAVAEGSTFTTKTASGLEVSALSYTPKYATERIWAVARGARYNYLFFLTVGGAADDRGTVRQMFDSVVPSFRLTSGS